ncbi:MAG: response regulator [Proteobacteria bacterium]|jgi:DNA-binding NtrC family response regulator|nr:response regulator [Pseudomonadota bacterium]
MTQKGAGCRVLLVDDEVEFLDSIARALSRRGFEVQRAEHGEAALKRLQKGQTDVVVLDVKMPGMDGVDVFREIKLRWPHLAVVLLTGHGTVSQAFTTSKEGVFEYLTKPCDIDNLVDVVRRAAMSAQGKRGKMSSRGEQSQLRLLIVDDEPEFLQSIAKVLVRRGVEVTTANSGAEALDHLGNRSFSVALLDMKMPGMNGMELLREIKRQNPLTEVIFLTGHPSVDLAMAGVKEGAFDYLTKPVDINELIDKAMNAHMLHLARSDRQKSEILERILRLE